MQQESGKFYNKKARIKTISKEQLNTITAIHLKAWNNQDASNTGTNNSNDFKTGAWIAFRTSLHQSIEDATALTAEHLELLKSIDQSEMLWMGNNKSSNSHQEMTN